MTVLFFQPLMSILATSTPLYFIQCLVSYMKQMLGTKKDAVVVVVVVLLLTEWKLINASNANHSVVVPVAGGKDRGGIFYLDKKAVTEPCTAVDLSYIHATLGHSCKRLLFFTVI